MPKRTLPRIVAVTPDMEPMTLRIRWAKGGEARVDLSGLIETFRLYEPLRHSPEVFAQVRLGGYGTDVVWPDDIDISADTLWRLRESSRLSQSIVSQIRRALAFETEYSARGKDVRARIWSDGLPRYLLSTWLATAA